MARSRQEIKQEMAQAYISNTTVKTAYSLPDEAIFENEFSLVSIENILFETIAFAIWALEMLFDIHKKELQTELTNQKSGTAAWYRTKALDFQYGFNLLVDSDKFNNTNATEDQIAQSKIVKYAAVDEGVRDSRVILKIAGEAENGVLAPITPIQRDSFENYIKKIRYAGVNVTVINYKPDQLNLDLKIYRNPLLIDEDGNSIKNGGKRVEEAIKTYIKNLPFNGEFVVEHLEKYLMDNVEGVEIAHVSSAQTRWFDPLIGDIGDYGQPEPIVIKTIPKSGYYTVPNFNEVMYVV